MMQTYEKLIFGFLIDHVGNFERLHFE